MTNKELKRLASARTVAAVERLAKADRRLAATVDQWDADPWLFNTPGGTIDLRTGKIRPHRTEDYMTKIAAAAPDLGCQTPLWLAFLERITGGDAGFQVFLQRAVGYALSGSIREHALFFLYGTGANGKSVFLETIAGIMGDYHKTAPIETFIDTGMERHPTDLAGLMGARLVTAIETEEGRRWAESKLKQLTGGDKIAARFMRQDFFEYTPQFKLFVAGNHKPGLRSADEAIRRRLHLLPFEVTIPLAERDRELAGKLKAEWPGILAWAVRGCLDWQENGLRPPEAVTRATKNYLDAHDLVDAWIADCCERDANAWAKRSVLFASWRGWTEEGNEYTGPQTRFYEKLEERGMRPHRDRILGRGFHGLRLTPRKS